MKIKSLILLFVLATASLIAGDKLLDFIRANSDGNNITIEWRSKDENNISYYHLERTSTGGIFTYITSQDPKGDYYTYKFVDKDAFMKDDNTGTQNKNVFTYRIKIVRNDNSASYSDNVTVTHSVNTVKRTWGMIKEMFR